MKKVFKFTPHSGHTELYSSAKAIQHPTKNERAFSGHSFYAIHGSVVIVEHGKPDKVVGVPADEFLRAAEALKAMAD